MGDKGATRGFITTIAQGLPGKWFLVVSTASLSSGAISPSFLSWNEFQEWWWPQQHQIVAVGYGCNVWRAAYASHVFALQTCNFFPSFDAASKYIVRQSEQGLRVTALAAGAGQWFVVMSKGGAMPALSQGLVCSTSLADFIRTFQRSRSLKFVVVRQSSDNALVLNALEDSYSILAVASSPTATLVALIKPALYRSQVAYHCDGSGSSNGWIVNNISDRTPCWYSQLTLDSPAHRQEFALQRTVLASSSAALFRRPTPPTPSAQTPALGTG
ncbi:unnamed protein product [Closterium sp. Yama58-4]|nr:unnamed protein product [Closterium sp. Yama58-4]